MAVRPAINCRGVSAIWGTSHGGKSRSGKAAAVVEQEADGPKKSVGMSEPQLFNCNGQRGFGDFVGNLVFERGFEQILAGA